MRKGWYLWFNYQSKELQKKGVHSATGRISSKQSFNSRRVYRTLQLKKKTKKKSTLNFCDPKLSSPNDRPRPREVLANTFQANSRALRLLLYEYKYNGGIICAEWCPWLGSEELNLKKTIEDITKTPDIYLVFIYHVGAI